MADQSTNTDDLKIIEILESRQARQDLLKEGLLRFLKAPSPDGDKWTVFAARIISIADGICDQHNYFNIGSCDINDLKDHVIHWKAGGKSGADLVCPAIPANVATGIWRYWLDLISPSVPAITGVALVDAAAAESAAGKVFENVNSLLHELLTAAGDVYITSVAIPDHFLYEGNGGMTLKNRNTGTAHHYALPFYFETNWPVA